MNPCRHPEHPHCTVWVMPGESVCAHGHVQPATPAAAGVAAPAPLPAEPLAQFHGQFRGGSAGDPADRLPAAAFQPAAPHDGRIMAGTAPPCRPHLHVSGFDPRAAGGRQVLKLDLRGMPPDCAPRLALLAGSRLRLDSGERHGFTRTGRGEWLPVFLEFSSRGLEHGQYRIELELHSRAGADSATPAAPAAPVAPARTWIATLLILAPRPDASLHDIHQTFLATHKNVRVSAVDASIARVRAGGGGGGGSVDIDVSASNAGIAHLDLDGGSGKIDLGFSSIAWDEELIEIDQPPGRPSVDAMNEPLNEPTNELTNEPLNVQISEPMHASMDEALRRPVSPPTTEPSRAARHPCPASTACLVLDAPGPGASDARHGLAQGVRFLRLFALAECVLGRYEPGASADLLLAHHLGTGPAPDGLTRRISARHAVIRRGRDGFEIEDLSRYGLLIDGAWPGKHTSISLRTGMRIELTASIPGVAVLEVGAVMPNGILLQRIDAGKTHEAFYLIDPERDSGQDSERAFELNSERDAGGDTGRDSGGNSGHAPAGRTHASALPLLFHRDGGFWGRDRAGGVATPLTPATGAGRLVGWPRGLHFAARAYPETQGGTIAHTSTGRPRLLVV